MDKYLVTRDEIDAYEGIAKIHFLNPEAQRVNKSLGDLTGLERIGFHLIEVPPGKASTEFHFHHHEEECVYILEGTADAYVGDEVFKVGAGDFLGYRAGGKAHKLVNTGATTLRCVVAGQRLDTDVADYPEVNKRLIRYRGNSNLADIDDLQQPSVGRKK